MSRYRSAVPGRELPDGDLVSLVAPGVALRWHARLPDGRRGDAHRGWPAGPLPARADVQADHRLRGVSDPRLPGRTGRRPGQSAMEERQGQGRESDNLATGHGFQPQHRGGQTASSRRTSDSGGGRLPAGRGPQHATLGARADDRRPRGGAWPQVGDDVVGRVHRGPGARRGEARHPRGASGQRRRLLHGRPRAGRDTPFAPASSPAGASTRATSVSRTPIDGRRGRSPESR